METQKEIVKGDGCLLDLVIALHSRNLCHSETFAAFETRPMRSLTIYDDSDGATLYPAFS